MKFAAAVISVMVLGAMVGCAPRPAARRADSSAARPAGKPAPAPEQRKARARAPVATADDAGPKLGGVQKAVTLRWTQKGLLRMSARASQLEGSEVTRTGTLVNFTAQLYENGKVTATLSAAKATADTKNRTVTAVGGVTMRSLVRKTTVKCDWARWSEKAQKVVGDGGVRIDSEMGTIEGAAFVADTALNTVTIKDSAEGLL